MEGGKRDGGRDGGWNHPHCVGSSSCSPFHFLVVPPFHALIVPSFRVLIVWLLHIVVICRRTLLSHMGIHSCSFWGVGIVWAVGFVGNGHRVEVGVGMAVVVGVYDDE